MKKIIYFLLLSVILSCSSEKSKTQETEIISLTEGKWHLHFLLDEDLNLPTIFKLEKSESNYLIEFYNGEEKIVAKEVILDGNQITITDSIFNTWFEGEIISKKEIKGYWYKNDKTYKIPFSANYGVETRFSSSSTTEANIDVSGKWEVDFSTGNQENHYKAIGLFTQKGNILTGTFVTETGDYRFLEGNVFGDSLFLSCYDGAHLFLFKAEFKNDTLSGKFWSGTHWKEPWVATRNKSFELTDPYSLTYLKEGYDKIAFSFPSITGDTISLTDEKYKNKVVIVNIMGPWCPNCKDETAYLTELYNQYHKQGLEIIALSFDKSDDFEIAKKTAIKLKEYFGANYDFVIAGKAGKIDASKALPMLNHIMSYPTTIFIDKRGNVRKIHTGFYGPGTGNYYKRYVEQTNDFVVKLLNEV